MASRSAGTPDIGEYWLCPACMARVTLSMSRGSHAKFGAPCEIERVMLVGELADDGEDSRADIRQLRLGNAGALHGFLQYCGPTIQPQP